MCVNLFCSMQLAARRYTGPVLAPAAACRSRPARDGGGPSVLGPATTEASLGGAHASAVQQQQHSLHWDAAAAGASLSCRPSPYIPHRHE